ncbi:hypothetical protein PWT90_01918 [Aphanocladium album]|nr:hypothetical protein PWT90_01918 [Aphanocladium album]
MVQQAIRFLILSDTHDDAFPNTGSLPTVDVVIHCGDLTMIGGLSNYRRALQSLAACAAEVKLVIPGSHDVSLDARWWEGNFESDDDEDEPVRARALFAPGDYTRRGVRFLEEGTRKITLATGARLKYEDRFNEGETRIPDDEDIDIVVTHGPPRPPSPKSLHGGLGSTWRLDLAGRQGIPEQQQRLGCPRLWGAIARVRQKMQCFGHIHEGYGAQIVTFESSMAIVTDVESVEKEGLPYVSTETEYAMLLVNAAILSHGEGNKPWLIDVVWSV